MIKKNLKILIITSIITLLPILAGLILWNQLPDQMPTHWNAAGEIDGWSNKLFAVFGFPLILVGAHWLGVIATFSDPKKAGHPEKILHMIFWFIPILSVVVHALTYAAALGKEVKMELILPVILGLLFTIIGNYLPKCKQNYTIGIKVPWTLDSEENWNRTHRLAGRLWVVCGLIILFTGFFSLTWIILPTALLMVLVPFVYSYMLYRKGV